MEGRPQDMGEAVVDPQEGVGKGHPRDGGGIVHLFPGQGVVPVPEGLGEIFEDELDRLEGERVRVVGREDRDVGLDGVGEDIQARIRRHRGRHGEGQVRIDDRHVRRHGVIGQRVLGAGLGVRHNGEGGDLRSGAARRGDSDQPGFPPQLRDADDPLAHVHEAHLQVFEAAVGILVEEPHRLGRVDRRAAAHGDDQVRAEFLHGRNAAEYGLDGGVGLDVGKDGRRDSRLPEIILQFFRHPLPDGRSGTDDEGAVHTHLLNLFCEECVEGACLEEDPRWNPEPFHVDHTLRHPLDVDEVVNGHVVRGAVLPAGAAAQGQ